MEPVLEILNLGVGYDEPADTLKGIDLLINPGEIIGIVGESGCGKSTLLKSIINLLPDKSHIEYESFGLLGRSRETYSEKEWQNLRGKDISIVYQNPGDYLNPTRRIGSQFSEHIRQHTAMSKHEIEKTIIRSLDRVHLHDYQRVLSAYPFMLSGGMNQRVSIAMAIALDSKLILADEPTSALDVANQVQVANELMELNEDLGTSVVVVTHNLGCAAYMADKLVVMKDGIIVESGAKSELVTDSQHEYTRELMSAI